MPDYLRQTQEQRAMVERWLDRMRTRFAGARGASDIGRVLARERHLERSTSPCPCRRKAIRFVRRFATLEELQDAKGQVDAQRCGPGCWRNHLLYRLVQTEDG